jgi:hypothetical protein
VRTDLRRDQRVWSSIQRTASDPCSIRRLPSRQLPLGGQQKIRYTLRIKATGINPESNVRQAITDFGCLIGHATGTVCCQASLGRCYSAMTVVARCVVHKFVHKYGQ